ncbi:hypothetical protein EVAR_40330_1 [Eumeta japonica]|uniref:Uncharacterized protein n=1 Tax=Eumeta variegata TaxID=151549 RepID=A0A4C1YDV9_EUMVA|nr:hypothetical protein EVAR_40330_1 [Eumeta japonica]
MFSVSKVDGVRHEQMIFILILNCLQIKKEIYSFNSDVITKQATSPRMTKRLARRSIQPDGLQYREVVVDDVRYVEQETGDDVHEDEDLDEHVGAGRRRHWRKPCRAARPALWWL